MNNDFLPSKEDEIEIRNQDYLINVSMVGDVVLQQNTKNYVNCNPFSQFVKTLTS
jgi:hypothetical protein